MVVLVAESLGRGRLPPLRWDVDCAAFVYWFDSVHDFWPQSAGGDSIWGVCPDVGVWFVGLT